MSFGRFTTAKGFAASIALLAGFAVVPPAQAQQLPHENYFGGGTITNVVNCPYSDYEMQPVTSRARVWFEDGEPHRFSVVFFVSSGAQSYRTTDDSDEDGWFPVTSVNLYSNPWIYDAELQIVWMAPAEEDLTPNDDVISAHLRVRGFEESPECSADYRVILRRQQS